MVISGSDKFAFEHEINPIEGNVGVGVVTAVEQAVFLRKLQKLSSLFFVKITKIKISQTRKPSIQNFCRDNYFDMLTSKWHQF